MLVRETDTMISILIHVEDEQPWTGLLDAIADFAGPESHVLITVLDGQWAVVIGDSEQDLRTLRWNLPHRCFV